MPGSDVDHSGLSMFLAKDRRHAALGVKARLPRAGVMRATLVKDVNHVIISMLLAVDRCLAPLHIEVRPLRAQVI